MHNSPHKIIKSHLDSYVQIVLELPTAKRKALWLPLPAAPQSIVLLIIILMGYGDIALSVPVLCPVLMELSVRLPASCLVVPISIASQEIHRGTYVVSHVVGHNAPWLHRANGYRPFRKVLFSIQNILEK